MSPFILFTILLWVFEIECVVWKHDLFTTVSNYLNVASKRGNFLKEYNEDPRGTMACVLDSAKLFQERIKFVGSQCNMGEQAFAKITKETNILKEQGNEEETPRLLSIHDPGFARQFIHFLADFWKATIEYSKCAPPRLNIFYKFIVSLEKFTTDLLHHCRVPVTFYPGNILRKKKLADEDLKKDIEEIFTLSNYIYTTKKIPFMLLYIDGQYKPQTVGCVRNATFLLFSALRSKIPIECPVVTNQIKNFKYAVLEESPLYSGSVMEIFMKTDAMLFQSSMEGLVLKRTHVLEAFEGCLQKTKLFLDENIKEIISTALDDYDLDVANCQVPLKFIHPPTPGTQVNTESSNQEKYINMDEPTNTAKFFAENTPLSVSCFKNVATDLFQLIGKLLQEKCPNSESLLEEFKAKVKTEISEGVLINADNDVHLFETEMSNLNVFGVKVFNVYEPCLTNKNIFDDVNKRDEFSVGAMRFQDLYNSCGANSESSFLSRLIEDKKDEPKPVDGQNEVSKNINSDDQPKNVESITDNTPEK